MLIIGIVLTLLVDRDTPLLESLLNLPHTQKYLIFLYLGCILIPIVLLQQRFSDQFDASWIFHTLPFDKPGRIMKGALKAVLVKYGGTTFVVLALPVLLIWGPHTLDDIVLSFLNMILTSLIIAVTMVQDLPFSKKYVVARDAQRGIAGLLLSVLPAGAGAVHYGLTFVPYGTLAGIMVSLTAVMAGMSLYGRMSWDRIKP